jgi:hypothetical protein
VEETNEFGKEDKLLHPEEEEADKRICSEENNKTVQAPELSQPEEIVDKDISLPSGVMAEPNTAIVAVGVVNGFVLFSASPPAKKKAAIDVSNIRKDLEEAAAVVQAAATKANVDVAKVAAAVRHEEIAEFDSPR